MDNYWLSGPNGSQLNLGSWLNADPGPDFGTHELLKAVYAQNSLVDGGQLAYESVGVRQFKFPLLLASSAAVPSGLPGVESWLRLLARPGGAFVDLMPEGVATGDMIRFDVLAGRWEPDYDLRVNRVGRRQGNVILDVQPLGYLPTMMILASTASVGLPAQVALSAAPGDYPALGEVVVQPQAPATQYFSPGGSYVTDGLAWGLSGQPSFLPFLSAASWLNSLGSVTPASSFRSPDGWVASRGALGQGSAWGQYMTYQLTQGLEPAYRGRYNAYAWLRMSSPVTLFPVQALLDAVPETGAARLQMASSNLAATVPAGANDRTPGSVFSIVPLGQIALPVVASGVPQAVRLRLWVNNPQDVLFVRPNFAGVFLQPHTGGAVLPLGIQAPTTLIAGSSPGRAVADGAARRAFIAAATGALSTQLAIGDAVAYRGQMPFVGGSVLSLNLMGLPRPARSYAYSYEVYADSPDYLYRFAEPSTTAPTLLDWSGNGHHGSWVQNSNTPWQFPGAPYVPTSDDAVYRFAADGIGSDLAVASINLAGRSFSVELWAKDRRVAGGTPANLIAWGGSHALGQHLQVAFSASDTHMFSLGTGDAIGSAPAEGLGVGAGLALYHHLAAIYDATAHYMALYRDGTFIASKSATSLRTAGTLMFIGKDSLGAASGMVSAQIADLAVYLDTVLPTSRIAAHFAAGASDVHPSTILYAEGFPQAAAVSVRARPRFQFLRGI